MLIDRLVKTWTKTRMSRTTMNRPTQRRAEARLPLGLVLLPSAPRSSSGA